MLNKKIVLIVSLAVIFISAMLYVVYKYLYDKPDLKIAPNVAMEAKKIKPKGLIYMTLTPADKVKLFSTTGIVRPRADEKISYASIDKYKGSMINMSFSNNGKWATFIADDLNDKVDKYIIVRASINDETKKIENFKEIATLNNSATKPAISDMGDILYAQASTSVVTLSASESYSIYLVDKSATTSKKISSGIYPKWLNDSNYTLLKNDGIYIQNIKNVNESYILLGNKDKSRKIENNVKYSISNDKTLLALTDINLNELSLFSIDKGSKYTTSFLASAKVKAFWPVISPDNKFVAAQSAELLNDKLINPKLEYYKIVSSDGKYLLSKLDYVLDLSKFVQTALFIDYWK